MKCDFCSCTDVLYSYPAKDFTVGFLEGSMGAWAACSECSRLIDKGNLEGLTERSVAKYLELEGAEDAEIREIWGMILDLHSQFMINRVGQKVEVVSS